MDAYCLKQVEFETVVGEGKIKGMVVGEKTSNTELICEVWRSEKRIKDRVDL